MAELLVEFLSEEIPARLQARAAADLENGMRRLLEEARLASETVDTFVTSRRLCVVCAGVPLQQPDQRSERRGPKVGAPQQALAGFLRSAGRRVEECEVRVVKGGSYYFAVVEETGRVAREVLPGLVTQLADLVAWPVSMRWSVGTRRWVRPLQSVLAVFEGQPLDGEIDLGRGMTLPFGNRTVGHRFLSGAAFAAKDFADYEAKLRRGYVMLRREEREKRIGADLAAAAAAEGLRVREDAALLLEVAGLVEWPVVCLGRIDARFIGLPEDVLITSMRSHQRYFAVLDAPGRLAPRFLFVANMLADDGGAAIVDGNERVLRARLSDAKYFWDRDRATKLVDRLPRLDSVVFHARLGSLGAKVRRVSALAATLAESIPGCDAEKARHAGVLAKADLASAMVGEFPDLQGVMGRYYALDQGEDPAVADAIAEHYSPLGPSDRCPSAPESVAVALADKIDTLVGFWAIDETPTGSKDPYALRRAALGITRLIIENELRLGLRSVAEAAYSRFDFASAGEAGDATTVATELMRFVADRLKVYLRDRGVPHEHVAAAFALEEDDDLVRLIRRVEALGDFVGSDDGANLMVAYRRAVNIVKAESKKDGCAYDGAAYDARGVDGDEAALFNVLVRLEDSMAPLVQADRFGDAMRMLAELRVPVDRFFTNVTVNVDDARARANRLRLLARIRSLMHSVADFSQIPA